jgi:hypothetical protein
MIPTKRSDRMRLALSLAAVLVASGCHVLDVSNPDIVPAGNLNDPAALPTIRAGAIGDFEIAYEGSGAQGSGGTTEGQILISGMLGDELINTETFPDRVFTDARQPQPESGTLTGIFRNLHRARHSTEGAAASFRALSDTTTNSGLAEMSSLAGFTYIFLAENYCSGVPVSTVNADGSFTFGNPLTTTQLLDTALKRFNQALVAASVLPAGATKTSMQSLARVGIARALLDKGDFTGADTAATPVLTSFNYLLQHDLNTTRQNNGVYNGMFKFKRYGVPDSSEGKSGLPWRTVADARTPIYRRTLSSGPEKGFDGTTPQYNESRYVDEKASVTLATGAEARLITAEHQLQTGDTTGMLATLNALRAAPPGYFLVPTAVGGTSTTTIAPMTALAAPVGPVAAVNMLFNERARWLWLTAHRLSDERRLERQYARPDSTVFPHGAYFKSGLTYGTAVNLPVAVDELNNPNFAQCLDRLP